MFEKVRLRFAPSPTGPLHLGGVRTALFSYLYAKKHLGEFILRIEDTDQSRYVEGAEDYILRTLDWCGIRPDESPIAGGKYGPYRQSERTELYQKYAYQLVNEGKAYYAFDTKEELETMRLLEQAQGNPNPMYGHGTRQKMRNSTSLTEDQVQELLDANTPYVIRFLVPENEEITVKDMIRGDVVTNSDQLDDKVLLKQDGYPTYHLAVVVDDHAMKISHVFRGEEWLPSAPFHVLLWEALGWENKMPHWAHLPLILKPDGKGKLSKRDGDRLGFSVFPLDWKDPETGIVSPGFNTLGFIPEGFDNMLLMLGWHDGGDKEIYALSEMIDAFDIKGVSHHGAKFDYQKAVWYNQQHVHLLSDQDFLKMCDNEWEKYGWNTSVLGDVIAPQIKDRISLVPEIYHESRYFFEAPVEIDLSSIKKNWSPEIENFFRELLIKFEALGDWGESTIEDCFKNLMKEKGFKAGAVMLPFRVMLVGEKRGVGVFFIAEIIEREDCINRIKYALDKIKE